MPYSLYQTLPSSRSSSTRSSIRYDPHGSEQNLLFPPPRNDPQAYAQSPIPSTGGAFRPASAGSQSLGRSVRQARQHETTIHFPLPPPPHLTSHLTHRGFNVTKKKRKRRRPERRSNLTRLAQRPVPSETHTAQRITAPAHKTTQVAGGVDQDQRPDVDLEWDTRDTETRYAGLGIGVCRVRGLHLDASDVLLLRLGTACDGSLLRSRCLGDVVLVYLVYSSILPL